MQTQVSAETCPAGTKPKINSKGKAEGCVTITVVLPGSSPSPGSAGEDAQWIASGCARRAGAYETGNTVDYTLLGPAVGGEPETVTWTYADGFATGSPLEVATSTITNPPAGSNRYVITCNANGLTFTWTTTLVPGAAGVDPLLLRAIAVARLSVPETDPGTNPDRTNPDRFGVVRIPVWLWINGPWDPVVESETQFGVTVTVVATPTKTTWNMGNGDEFDCAPDEQVEWQPGLTETDTQCSYTYKHSSAGLTDDQYEISAGVTWDYTWFINTVAQGGFGSYENLEPFPYAVGEIQVLETGR